MDKKSILEMARGSIIERTDYEMSKIIDNILDVNTKATAKRKLTLTIEIVPDDDRRVLSVKVGAKSALAETTAVSTALYVSKDSHGDLYAVEMTAQIPGQRQLYGEEEEQPSQLKIVKIS